MFFTIGGGTTDSTWVFLQICSVGEGIPLSGAFRFSAALDDGGGRGSSSSESDSVKSITSVCVCDLPPNDGLSEGGTSTDEPLPKDGESSLFTCPSSSSSSESRTTISTFAFFFPLRSDEEAPFVFTGDAGSFMAGFGATGGCARFQAAEPYLLSDVCHSPSASTMTSSTLSGLSLRMPSK